MFHFTAMQTGVGYEPESTSPNTGGNQKHITKVVHRAYWMSWLMCREIAVEVNGHRSGDKK